MIPLVVGLQPLLKLAEGAAAAKVNNLSRAQVVPKLGVAVPIVASRLERDKITPQVKSVDPALERQLIRDALYLLCKEVLRPYLKGPLLPRGADAIRDLHDDQVVAIAAPLIDPSMTTEAAVVVVADAFVERLL